MTDNRARLLLILFAILAAAFLRLVPHPPNFTPVGALALFSGAMLGRRWLAFAAPLGALVISDLVLGFYPGVAFVYAATALMVLVGWLLTGRRSAPRIAAAAVGSAILFFIVTNFGMWLFSGLYPLTAAGLAACFVAAVPFFQNSLAGDLVFSALLFGGWAIAERSFPLLREPRAQPA
jgi:hypothetical protein